VDLLDGEHVQPGCSQFERQRDAVQPPHDLSNDRAVSFCEGKIGANSPGAFEKKLHTFRTGDFFKSLFLFRQAERRNLERGLTLDEERLASGDQHSEFRTVFQQLLGEFGAVLHDMLDIVEQEKQFLSSQVIRQRIEDFPARLLVHVQRGGHPFGDQPGIGERGELNQPDSIRVVFDDFFGGLQHQARLARTPRTKQGEQRRVLEQVFDLCQFFFASDEGGELAAQVVFERRQRFQRREFRSQIGMAELVDLNDRRNPF